MLASANLAQKAFPGSMVWQPPGTHAESLLTPCQSVYSACDHLAGPRPVLAMRVLTFDSTWIVGFGGAPL